MNLEEEVGVTLVKEANCLFFELVLYPRHLQVLITWHIKEIAHITEQSMYGRVFGDDFRRIEMGSFIIFCAKYPRGCNASLKGWMQGKNLIKYEFQGKNILGDMLRIHFEKSKTGDNKNSSK